MVSERLRGTLRGREKAVGAGGGERVGGSFLPFPSHRPLHALSFFSQLPAQPLCDTQRGRWGGERRDIVHATSNVYSPCLMSEAMAKIEEQNPN